MNGNTLLFNESISLIIMVLNIKNHILFYLNYLTTWIYFTKNKQYILLSSIITHTFIYIHSAVVSFILQYPPFLYIYYNPHIN